MLLFVSWRFSTDDLSLDCNDFRHANLEFLLRNHQSEEVVAHNYDSGKRIAHWKWNPESGSQQESARFVPVVLRRTMMEFLTPVVTVLRILLLIGHLWGVMRCGGAFSSSDKDHTRERTAQASLKSTIEEGQARQLIQEWCSAFAQLNPARIAELQASEFEIVDRFGDLHRLSGRKEQERFWAGGFDIIQARDFHPQCETVDVVFISPHVAMVHANVSYPRSIRLKGGERIPPYSEIHTFVTAGNEGRWLIFGHNVTKQASE